MKSLHRWLGLSSGFVLFVIALTGSIYSFKTEIENKTQWYRSIKTVPFHSPIVLDELMKMQLENDLTLVKIDRLYLNKYKLDKTYVFLAKDKLELYQILFVNPYTGTCLKKKDIRFDFFSIIMYIHTNFLFPAAIGKPFVGVMLIVFIGIMLLGIVLWWPKNKAARKQRLSFKWRETTKWKRKNYDLHNILGFYSSLIGFLIILTGLSWSFQWVREGSYKLSSLSMEAKLPIYPYFSIEEKPNSKPLKNTYDRALKRSLKNKEKAYLIMLFPSEESDALTLIESKNPDSFYTADYTFYNPIDLKSLKGNGVYGAFKQATFADKVQRINYDLHTGSFLGLFGRGLYLFISLILASLPLTGYLIYRGRKRKNTSHKKKDN